MRCLESPSKINIGLAVTGRRPDGYHLLESLFWPIRFGDEIEIEEAKENAVTASWDAGAPFSKSALPQGEENLVAKALKAALAEAPSGYRIHLRKKVPLGGGLGGGSSNAGTVLKFLTREGRISSEIAENIAPAIGADVPFFLAPAPAWVTGIGERRLLLRPTTELLSSLFFLLILFPRPTNTPAIFSHYRSHGNPFSPNLASRWAGQLDSDAFTAYLGNARNDLEPAAVQHYPLIGEVLAQLRATHCDFASLSGSGSSCFAIFRSRIEAGDATKDLSRFLRKHHCKSIIAESYFDAR